MEAVVNSDIRGIKVLDSLRGFAALSVCLFHFIFATVDFIKEEWILRITGFGVYGVQTFFVISGFIIPYSMYRSDYKFRNFFKYMFKRLARLEPPYVFSIVLCLLYFYFRQKFLGKTHYIEVSLTQVLLHFGYLIPFFRVHYHWLNEIYWTLAIEFQFYIFMGFLFVPLVKTSLPVRIFIYAVLLIAKFHNASFYLFFSLPFFLLGILLCVFKTQIIGKIEYYLATVFASVFCFWQYEPALVIFALIPVFFILYFEQLKIIGLNFAGKISYSIYLIHPIIGSSVINIFSHHFTHPFAKCLIVTCGLAITILSAWLMYVFIEKPSKKYASALRY